MAFIGTLRTSYRTGRAADRLRRRRSPLLTAAARALGHAAARVAPRLAALRTLVLSLAGFTLIDFGVWEWHRIAGLIAAGVSLLILEWLSSSDETSRDQL